MFKIIFNEINSTFDQISSEKSFFEILDKDKFIIQSFEQKKGVGRGAKKWSSPKGNLYLTLNHKINSKDTLKMSFYLCYLVHKFIRKNFSIKLDYKWPNDLYYEGKKLVGIVSKSKIISNNCYIQSGLGINLNRSPIKISTSLSKIISKKVSVLQFSRNLLVFLNKNLDLKVDNLNIINYLNIYLLDTFKLNHPIYKNGKVKIIKLEKNFSLVIKFDGEYKNIFFGELL